MFLLTLRLMRFPVDSSKLQFSSFVIIGWFYLIWFFSWVRESCFYSSMRSCSWVSSSKYMLFLLFSMSCCGLGEDLALCLMLPELSSLTLLNKDYSLLSSTLLTLDFIIDFLILTYTSRFVEFDSSSKEVPILLYRPSISLICSSFCLKFILESVSFFLIVSLRSIII